MDTPSVLFKAIRPHGRCRLRNRVGLEKPTSTRDGPSPRTGSSATASSNSIWVFGGLVQTIEEVAGEFEGHLEQFVSLLKPTNELWSFDVSTMLWTWHGCEMVGEIPSPRHRHGACAVNGGKGLIVLGGALDVASNHWTNNTPYLFDLATETWSKVPYHGPLPMPGPLSLTPFQPVNGGGSNMRILYVGSDTVVEGSWDGMALSWADTRALPRPRGSDACRCASAVEDLVVLYGGGNGIEAFGRTARGSAAESAGGHPLVSVNGLDLEYPCSLPPLKPPPDTHPSLRVTSRHKDTSATDMKHTDDNDDDDELTASSSARLLLGAPSKSAAVNNSTVPKRSKASGRQRNASSSSSSSVHSELDRLQASLGFAVARTRHRRRTKRGSSRSDDDQRVKVSQPTTPENYGPNEFGSELLSRAAQCVAPVLPPPSSITASVMELEAKDHSSIRHSSTLLPSMPLLKSTTSAFSSSSSLQPPKAEELNPDAPPYEVRCGAASSAGPFYLLLGGNLPHPSDPSGTQLPLIASDQFHLLNCATNEWTRFAARSPPPAGLALASTSLPSSSSLLRGEGGERGTGGQDDDGGASSSSSLPSLEEESWKSYNSTVPLNRAGHAMCFLDGRLWVFGGSLGDARKVQSAHELECLSAERGCLLLCLDLGFRGGGKHGKRRVDEDDEDDDRAPPPPPEQESSPIVLQKEDAFDVKEDIDLRMSDGHTFKTVVVKDLNKFIQLVGEENCFERSEERT